MTAAGAGMRLAHATVVGDTRESRYAQRIAVRRHTLLADEPPARGGADAGPTPFDYLLAALGACTSITLRMYAERKGWDLGTVTVTLDFLQDGDVQRVARDVTCSASLTDAQRAKLAQICERTPVTRTLRAGVAIETRLRGG